MRKKGMLLKVEGPSVVIYFKQLAPEVPVTGEYGNG